MDMEQPALLFAPDRSVLKQFSFLGRPQNHFQQQSHHQHHQQEQHRGRNRFDDKNRETFGDDFVEHHAVQQPNLSRQQGQGNHLITPGHVHVLGILRGARERQGPGTFKL